MRASAAIRVVLIVSAALLSPPGPAPAQESDLDSAMRWFDDVDADRDGTIAVEEIVRVEGRQARRMDADGDGRLTLEEFNYGIPADRGDVIARRSRRFGAMDADLDGFVTQAETKTFAGRVVAEADQDGDARVTRAEFEASIAPQD